jgi:DNA-binding protein HU-beta
MANTMSKSALMQRIVEGHPSEIARKDVKGVIDAVAAIGHKQLKKTGAFVVPGLAKFIVIKKPATKARQASIPSPKSPRSSRQSRPAKSSGLDPSRLPKTPWRNIGVRRSPGNMAGAFPKT